MSRWTRSIGAGFVSGATALISIGAGLPLTLSLVAAALMILGIGLMSERRP